MSQRNWFSPHNHTEFSNLKIIDSINRADRMIDYAWELGMSGFAFTDHDCISGHLKFLKAYKKKLEKEWKNIHPEEDLISYPQMSDELDFKIALGNEIYLSEEGACRTTENNHYWHMILIAKDKEGWRQIKQLSSAAWSRAWVKGIQRTPTYPSDLSKFVKGGHLICTTACLGGYVAWCWKQATLIKNGQLEVIDGKDSSYYLMKLDNHLKGLRSIFGKENFFIELQPNEEPSEQNEYNKYMIEHYWGKYNFVCSTDAHYLKAEEREIHKAFLNSKSSSDREVDSFYKYTYMMGIDELKERFNYMSAEQFNVMIANTRRIKDMVEYFEIEQPKVIAKVPYEHLEEYKEDLEVFNDVDQETYPNFYYYLHSDIEADRYLAELVAHGYIEKYDESWSNEVYYKRLEEEFWTIKTVGDAIKKSMSDYFITMSKMVELMWEAGSLVGPSRGSAGAMLINFLTGITQMNPVQLNLPFVWRFMHPSRPDYPDIDVDSESDKRAAVFNKVRNYFVDNSGDLINVCTFGTEGTKSALKTAGRGLNIDDDLITYLTSMIPNERGFDWNLKECYYGNEDEDRKPIKAFKDTMDQNPKLWELAQSIEGLITRLGVHASGVVAINGDFTDYGSYVKTTKGQLVTAFDLHDQEETGLIKYDFLTVSALDRIHQCLNYLLEDKQIEWQGDLRSTYTKYLAPQNLIYDDKDMWDLVGQGAISSLFQFDTTVGSQAVADIQPRSLNELAISSSLMRLMSDGELPLAKYARFKRVPQLWYNEMEEAGLTADEVKVLEKYLTRKCGVGESQEVVMQMVMDPHISNFTMQEANKLRKTIAKKQFREIDKVKELFYQKGKEVGSSENLLNYVWDKQIATQLGYSFSEIHTTGYALIALQEMNLAYRFPILYWNCACLSVDSSAIASSDFYNLVDENIIAIDDDDEVEKKTQNKMDYSKLAGALDKFSKICNIELPDINESRLSFTPDIKRNTIVYGLKGISRVTDPSIEEIMNNRPFSSLTDFLKRTTKKVVMKDKIVNLIKCGAFDNIEHLNRREIATKYIWYVCEPKSKLTMQNANMLIEQGLFPKELEYYCDVYKLTKELRKHRDPDKLWYCGDRLNIPADKFDSWRKIIGDSKLIAQDLMIDGEPRRVIDSGKWDVFYETNMNPLRKYIKENSAELLKKMNQNLFDAEFNKYFSGDEAQWELDSLNFYFGKHPLEKVIPQMDVNITAVQDIVEGAQDGMFFIKGKEIPKMKLFSIAGTVIDKNNTKGLITVQCPSGVVNVKCYKDLYALYAKSETEVDENGNETTTDESFFEKGTHLLITGIQRGATFVPKVYKNSRVKCIEKIVLDSEGNFKEFQAK